MAIFMVMINTYNVYCDRSMQNSMNSLVIFVTLYLSFYIHHFMFVTLYLKSASSHFEFCNLFFCNFLLSLYTLTFVSRIC